MRRGSPRWGSATAVVRPVRTVAARPAAPPAAAGDLLERGAHVHDVDDRGDEADDRQERHGADAEDERDREREPEDDRPERLRLLVGRAERVLAAEEAVEEREGAEESQRQGQQGQEVAEALHQHDGHRPVRSVVLTYVSACPPRPAGTACDCPPYRLAPTGHPCAKGRARGARPRLLLSAARAPLRVALRVALRGGRGRGLLGALPGGRCGGRLPGRGLPRGGLRGGPGGTAGRGLARGGGLPGRGGRGLRGFGDGLGRGLRRGNGHVGHRLRRDDGLVRHRLRHDHRLDPLDGLHALDRLIGLRVDGDARGAGRGGLVGVPGPHPGPRPGPRTALVPVPVRLLAAPAAYRLLAALGDLLVRLPRAHRVLGGEPEAAQREALRALLEPLQLRVAALARGEGGDDLGDGGARDGLRLAGAGDGAVLDLLGVALAHRLDAGGRLGAELVEDRGQPQRPLDGQLGGTGGEVEGGRVGEGLAQIVGDGHGVVLPEHE
ncbi:hypothetical protein STTU_3609 [Streptomyces sp. Tu6071]|nr:hypothetical protein STTU_3609 [Streptomyces sp. Tu6071]